MQPLGSSAKLSGARLVDRFAKRSQGKCSHFEMLSSPGNPDNRNAEQQTESQVSQANPESSQEYPENIHDDAQAAPRITIVCHRTAERPQSQEGQLQRLQAKRDAYDRDHKQQA